MVNPNFDSILARLRSNDAATTKVDWYDDLADGEGKNKKTVTIGSPGACAIASALKDCPGGSNTSLELLNLFRSDVGDDGAKALAESFRGCASLNEVNVAENGIGPEGACAIAQSLKDTKIKFLNLWCNDIGIEGVQALANALKDERCALEKLRLGKCKIDADGAQALAEALEVNATLKTLDLYGNEVGHLGARAIAGALKKNVTLIELNLVGNDVGDKGARAIAGGMRGNKTLLTLHLGNNGIGPEGGQALIDALGEEILEVDLYENKIGNEAKKNLGTVLYRNGRISRAKEEKQAKEANAKKEDEAKTEEKETD